MQVRPDRAVRQIRRAGDSAYEIAAKTASCTALIAHAFLDQKTRPRGKQAKPRRPSAKRIIQTKSARRARLAVLARLHDRAREEDQRDLGRKLLKQILKFGGLTALVDTPHSGSLVQDFVLRGVDVRYVVDIVDYLVRTQIHADQGIPSTIEDAKGFVWLSREEYCVTKIGQVWEVYKLVAPYLYALHLQKSFRPSELERIDNALDWVAAFVKKPQRVQRFLGHAAFAMDVLKTFARDQRERDFDDIPRVQPSRPRFSEEEKLISSSVDRGDPEYGLSRR